MSFTLLGNIPLPDIPRRGRGVKKWEWGKLKVGEAARCGGDPDDGNPKTILSHAKKYGKLWDKEFVGQIDPENPKVITIWRTR